MQNTSRLLDINGWRTVCPTNITMFSNDDFSLMCTYNRGSFGIITFITLWFTWKFKIQNGNPR